MDTISSGTSLGLVGTGELRHLISFSPVNDGKSFTWLHMFLYCINTTTLIQLVCLNHVCLNHVCWCLVLCVCHIDETEVCALVLFFQLHCFPYACVLQTSPYQLVPAVQECQPLEL